MNADEKQKSFATKTSQNSQIKIPDNHAEKD